MKSPNIFAVVGTRELFETASHHLADVPYGIKLDETVPAKELHIRDVHGHVIAIFNLKDQKRHE